MKAASKQNVMTYSIPGLDARYTVAQEFCGYAEARWVLRFCGKFLSSHSDKLVAHSIAHMHNEWRDNTEYCFDKGVVS